MPQAKFDMDKATTLATELAIMYISLRQAGLHDTAQLLHDHSLQKIGWEIAARSKYQKDKEAE